MFSCTSMGLSRVPINQIRRVVPNGNLHLSVACRWPYFVSICMIYYILSNQKSLSFRGGMPDPTSGCCFVSLVTANRPVQNKKLIMHWNRDACELKNWECRLSACGKVSFPIRLIMATYDPSSIHSVDTSCDDLWAHICFLFFVLLQLATQIHKLSIKYNHKSS